MSADTSDDTVAASSNADVSADASDGRRRGEVALDAGRRAELEQEREFLLTSLTDLDRERAAGDLDDHDYEVLREGYTARAAAVLRELERGSEPAAPEPKRSWKPALIGSVVTVVLFVIVWWALSASSAQRLPEQSMTGLDPRSERQQMLSQAYQVQFQNPAEAAVIYQLVLDEYPQDTEALTYGGWTRALAVVRSDVDTETKAAELKTAAEMLTEAVTLDPNYPDPRCLRGVLYGRFLERAEPAIDDLDACLALNPPADMRGLIEGLRADLAPGSAASTTAP